MKTKQKVTRKETHKQLEQFHLAVELVKVINHFFPDLLPLLKQTKGPRNQSYITYPNVVLLMTRILSSIFYTSSMKKTSQKFNSETVIHNIWELCREKALETLHRLWYIERKEGCLFQQTPFRSPTPKVEFPKRAVTSQREAPILVVTGWALFFALVFLISVEKGKQRYNKATKGNQQASLKYP